VESSRWDGSALLSNAPLSPHFGAGEKSKEEEEKEEKDG
jgi:hypothetical protein